MDELNQNINASEPQVSYTEENIRHLSDMEHVRTRPGMYIGRLGDGSQAEAVVSLWEALWMQCPC